MKTIDRSETSEREGRQEGVCVTKRRRKEFEPEAHQQELMSTNQTKPKRTTTHKQTNALSSTYNDNNNKSAPLLSLPGEIACVNLKLIARCHLLLTMTIQAHRAHNRLKVFSIVENIFC